jgi:transposase
MDDKQAVYGVDVSKAKCAVGSYDCEAVMEIRNELPELARWLRGIARGSIVAMEATGAYHKPLAALAHAAGMRVFILNPQALKHYARGIGVRAKTDPVDARPAGLGAEDARPESLGRARPQGATAFHHGQP